MTTRAFSTLAAKIGLSVPKCPHPIIVDHVRDAAIRTCERSLLWRAELPPRTLVAGQHEYDFNAPGDTGVQAVLSATINDRPVEFVPIEQAVQMFPRWPIETDDLAAIAEQGSEPRVMSQVGQDQFVVLPSPDAERPYTLRMVCALKPARQALDMDAAVFDALETPILHGTLQSLLVLPDVEWGDRELATYHARQYLFTVTEARAQANLGVLRKSLTAQAPAKFA